MDERKSAGKDLALLLIGALICFGGLYLLAQNVTVRPMRSQINYWGYMGGRSMNTGLIVLPLILGIMLMVIFPKNFIGKVVTVIGTLFIILGIINATNLEINTMSLYQFLLILAMIFGGAALALRILLLPGSQEKVSKKEANSRVEKLSKIVNEQDSDK